MKRVSYVVLVITLFSFFVLSPSHKASAAEAGPFYVGVTGAYLIPDKMTISGEGGEIKLGFNNSWMLGAKAGYILPAWKYFAVELEYFHFFASKPDQTTFQTSGGDFSQVTDGEFTSDNAFANFLLRYPGGKFHPYVGFGLGWAWSRLKASGLERIEGVTGTPSFDEKDNRFAWQALVGLNYEITRDWSAGLGYRYYQTKPKFSDTEVTFSTSMITLGINFHF